MMHYCVLPITLSAPHCKLSELSISHVLHSNKELGTVQHVYGGLAGAKGRLLTASPTDLVALSPNAMQYG